MKTIEVPRQYVGTDEPEITVEMNLTGRMLDGRMGTEYVVKVDGKPVIQGTDLRSGCWVQVTHEDMVRSLCDFLGAYGDSFNWQETHHGGWRKSEFADGHTEEQAQFLMANYERFQMAGMEDLGEEQD